MKSSEPILDIGLYLRGNELDPAVVTSTLGIEASKTRIKGEKWHTSTNKEVTAKTGLWFLDVKTESPLFRDRLAWLKQKLGSHSGNLLNIPGVQEAEISVFIALATNDRGGGDYEFYLAAEDLTNISKLGIPVTFAITHTPHQQRGRLG